jgi:bifunctional non-homologous end joining protein LigD
MLYRHGDVPVTFLIFDVLRAEGRELVWQPYRERRRILEGLGLGRCEGGCRRRSRMARRYGRRCVSTSSRASVAKCLDKPYLPGERG